MYLYLEFSESDNKLKSLFEVGRGARTPFDNINIDDSEERGSEEDIVDGMQMEED